MRTIVGEPGARSRMRIHQRGQRVEVNDGIEPVTLLCRSSAMARELVRSLDFLATAHPDWQPGEVLLRAVHEVEWARNFRRMRRMRWQPRRRRWAC